MSRTEKIIARNVKNIINLRNGAVESVAIADFVIIRDDCTDRKYRLEVGENCVYVDDIEIWEHRVHFMKNGDSVAWTYLAKD